MGTSSPHPSVVTGCVPVWVVSGPGYVPVRVMSLSRLCLSRLCPVQVTSCPGCVLSGLRPCLGCVCPGCVCPGCVLSGLCLSGLRHSTTKTYRHTDIQTHRHKDTLTFRQWDRTKRKTKANEKLNSLQHSALSWIFSRAKNLTSQSFKERVTRWHYSLYKNKHNYACVSYGWGRLLNVVVLYVFSVIFILSF